MKHKYVNIRTVLALGATVLFSAPAMSASEDGNATKNQTVRVTYDVVPSEHASADKWWETHANNAGFVEALTHINSSVETLRADPAKALKDSTDSRTPLYWLKRTMTIYPSEKPNRYHLPVAHNETKDWTNGLYATIGRGIFFFTRTMGKPGDSVEIKTGSIPAGSTCFAATGRDFSNKDQMYMEQVELTSDGVTNYTFSHTGALMLGCGDPDKQLENKFVQIDISDKNKPSNLYILGQNTQADWENTRNNNIDIGFSLMFDGRANTVVPNSIGTVTNEIVGKVLGDNLQTMASYEKVNGMDGSDPLFKSSQGTLFINYKTCCYADFRNGFVAVGFSGDRMNFENGVDWGLWHELGHQYEPYREFQLFPEIQVNRYSIEACRTANGNKDIPLELCHQNLKGTPSWDPDAVKDFLLSTESYDDYENAGDVFNRLRFLTYLRFAYGEDFFPKVNQIRLKTVHAVDRETMYDKYWTILGDKQRIIDFTLVAYSTAAGHDLREYFDRWGLHYSDQASARVADLGLLKPNDRDPSLPQAHAGEDRTVVATTNAKMRYILDGRKSLNAVKYQWERLNDLYEIYGADEPVARVMVDENTTGESVYRLTVTDKNGVQDSAIMTLTVVAANATISGATSFTEGQSVSLSAQANFDDELTYLWTVRNANSGDEVLQGTNYELDLSQLAAGSYQVTVEVSGEYGGRYASAQQDITVETDVNRLPVVVVSGPAKAEAGVSIALSAAGSSAASGNTLDYRWTVSPPLVFNTNGAELTFRTPKLTADTTYKFTVTANDGTFSSKKEHLILVKKAVESGCSGIPKWEKKSYQGATEVQFNGRSYTSKWYAEAHHTPGAAGWTGDVWRDNGVCQ
ncbi:M60 family metallopeptidase [Glaciimonas sp. GG7]